MQWINDREKQLGVELGFVIRKGGGGRGATGGSLANVTFAAGDTEHNGPREGLTRPASIAEVKMWRALMKNL